MKQTYVDGRIGVVAPDSECSEVSKSTMKLGGLKRGAAALMVERGRSKFITSSVLRL